MATESQKRAMRRYYARCKQNMKTYIFKVDTRKEPELAEWLDKKKPRAQYIREAIRRDMERGD